MNKKIALSIDEMKYLESLELDTSDASMTYHQYTISNNGELTTDYDLIPFPYNDCVNNIADKSVLFPAYTLQDILNKLPLEVICKKVQCGFGIGYFWWYKEYNDTPILGSNNELTSSYQMLLWCIENNYIKTNKV